MNTSFVSLGGNIGPVSETFRQAWTSLTGHSRVQPRQFSSLYRTSVVGSTAGDDFLNAVASIDTDLPPQELLQLLQSIETRLGRTRGVRWAPRTLDLDLILYGARIVDLPEVRIPHPACWYRRFVLDPLAEIAPNAVHPEKRETIQRLRDRLLSVPFRVVLSGGEESVRQGLMNRLTREFEHVEFLDESSPSRHDASMIFWMEAAQRCDAQVDKATPERWLNVSRPADDVEQNMREALQSALGTVERLDSV